jgi:hypothetical protein
MKVIVFVIVLVFSFAPSLLMAQSAKAEKVHSIVKIMKEFDWYVEQHELWKVELEKDNKNTDGWLSYYTTTRMAKIMSPNLASKEEWYKKMGEVISEMKKAIPETYEYYYIQGYHMQDKQKGIEHIHKAYEIDPTRPDVYDELITHYEISREKEKLEGISKKWKASGAISPTLLLWNYNMLMSTEPNSILITVGDNDTYPSLVLQYAEGVRKDVTVLNTGLILVEAYRAKLFTELEITPLEGKKLQIEDVLNHLIKHRGNRPLYFAIGSSNCINPEVKENLYNVGLAMRYTEDGADNTSLLVRNFENNILLEHLNLAFYPEEFPQEVKRFNLVYIPGLLMLHRHYGLIEDVKSQEKVKTKILNVIKGTDQEGTILNALKNNGKC